MASAFCKTALRVSSRSIVNCSRNLTPKSISPISPSSSFSSPSSRVIPRASRILSALGSVESIMPLHSAIATARLTSSIAVDSSCWSMLSRGLEKTL